MNVDCRIHGKLPWLGHGMCVDCGRVHKHLLEAIVCPCGSKLLPEGKHFVEKLFRALQQERAGREAAVPFAGRPMCAKCAGSAGASEAPVAEGDGKVDSGGYED